MLELPLRMMIGIYLLFYIVNRIYSRIGVSQSEHKLKLLYFIYPISSPCLKSRRKMID